MEQLYFQEFNFLEPILCVKIYVINFPVVLTRSIVLDEIVQLHCFHKIANCETFIKTLVVQRKE